MVGFSGGGWQTTLSAALDPRITMSLPCTPPLPEEVVVGRPRYDYEDCPQPRCKQRSTEPGWYLSVANWTELYILSALEPGRSSLQLFNEHDPVTSSAASRHDAIRKYVARVQMELRAQRGGNFSAVVASSAQHAWTTHSLFLAMAAFHKVAVGGDPVVAHLPCDLLVDHQLERCPIPNASSPLPTSVHALMNASRDALGRLASRHRQFRETD